MTVKELKEILETMDDSTLVITPGLDRRGFFWSNYVEANFSLENIRIKDERMIEYVGGDFEKQQALVIS